MIKIGTNKNLMIKTKAPVCVREVILSITLILSSDCRCFTIPPNQDTVEISDGDMKKKSSSCASSSCTKLGSAIPFATAP